MEGVNFPDISLRCPARRLPHAEDPITIRFTAARSSPRTAVGFAPKHAGAEAEFGAHYDGAREQSRRFCRAC